MDSGEPVRVFASAADCERAFYQAFAECDMQAMAAVWDEDDVNCIHPGGSLLRTREAILASWAAIFEDAVPPGIRVHVLGRVSDGGLAVHLVQEHISHAGHTSHVIATNVFRRGAAGWRLVAHHGSVPAMRRESAATGSLH